MEKVTGDCALIGGKIYNTKKLKVLIKQSILKSL